jgi:hypothetical protein
MKRTVTKRKVCDAFAVLNRTRLAGLKKNDDKVAVLKVVRELRPVAQRYEADIKDAREKLKPDGYDERLEKAVAYEASRMASKQTDKDTGEYEQFRAENMQYQRAVADAMAEEDTAEVELEFDPLTAALLEELMTLNDWTVEQYFMTEDVTA